jgi:hypothetical protein
MRCRETDLYGRLIFVGPIPAASRRRIRELDDDDAFGERPAIEQLELAAAGDHATAKAGDGGKGDRHVCPVGGGVGYVDVTDDEADMAASDGPGAVKCRLNVGATATQPERLEDATDLA